MPSAGALPAPLITPLREQFSGLSSSAIDTSIYIEISTDVPNCRLYFTTDGSKPMPFQRKIGGREVTFRYYAPFTLKPGKRVIKAVAISKDKRLESAIVSKAFNVSDTGEAAITSDSSSFFDTTDVTTDSDTSTTVPSKSRRNRSKTPTRKGRATPKEAWASTGSYPYGLGSGADEQVPPTSQSVQIPDGPFNPTNYSGTQINVWGAPPGGVWPSGSGIVAFGNGPPVPQYPVQYGFLTEQMIQGLNKPEKPPAEKPLTVADLKKMMADAKKDAPPPPKPAIEYRPTYKDPPLNPVSPGNGDFKENLLHIYAHMLDYAKNNSDFRLRVSEPKIGKILEAKFEDEGDGYRINLVMAKPGIPRGSVKKVAKPPPAPKKKNGSGSETEKKKKPAPKKSDPYYEMETENLNQEGTVVAYDKFNAEQDAEVLNKAVKGLGTDEDAIINVLCYRSNPQRMEICTTYKTMFGKDLVDDLKGDTSGNFFEVLKSLLMAPAEFDAYQCRKAIKGLGTDEDVLIEILCTRSNAQMQEIKRVYKEKFNKELEKDIIGDTSGDFKKLLVGLVQANRSDSQEVDRNKAHQDAKALFEAGEGKWGTDESRFNAILVSRSYPQLRATFEEYQKISKKDIEEVLKSEFSGDVLSGMKSIVRCVRNKFGHFARQLQKTMKGLGTDDDTLIRIIVSRCEIDLKNIKEEFQTLTGQTLDQYVTDDTSGDYRNTVLALIVGGPPPEMAAKSGDAFVEAVKAKTEEELDEDVRMESEPVQEDPTLVPFEGFNAEQDCEALKKAMKGFGTDEDAIIEVLSKRAGEQRREINLTYKTMFGKDLGKELSGELSGNFKTLCVEMLLGPAEFDAKQINKAVKGLGTDERALIEIICTRTNAQLTAMKEAYKTMYQKDVEADIEGDTSGPFKRLLVGCLQANRPEGQEFDRNKAKQDAQALLDAGEKKWGTDESRFNVILVSRSYPQLRATFQEYAKLANKDIEDSISSEMSGDLKNGMMAIVRVIRSKATHFASELHRAMKGLGTDDDTLVRVVASRCEVDMVQIKEEFQRNFKQSLYSFIVDDTSGDYRKMLCNLIGQPYKK
ncbi:annexin A6-like [Babylonia areolata]|uniref:annexin A6-like n=1 Tax=Babylonia areolata TaxID=304850 RepID=UPI003FD659A5